MVDTFKYIELTLGGYLYRDNGRTSLNLRRVTSARP
jgi:hypothetical protein